MNTRAAVTIEIFEVEGGNCTVSKATTIEWCKRFKIGEISLEDLSRSGGRPSTMNFEALRKLLKGAATTNKYLQIVVG